MNGTMLIFRAAGPLADPPMRVVLTSPPELQALHDALGGWLERVPGFDAIMLDGTAHRCVALCDEHGKGKKLPINRGATLLWAAARQAAAWPLTNPDGSFIDWLVGTVVVLLGDDEFMAAL